MDKDIIKSLKGPGRPADRLTTFFIPYLAAPPMNGGVWYNFNKEKIKSVYQYLGMSPEIFDFQNEITLLK